MADRTDFSLRRATVDDGALLAELGARLFEEAFGAANEPENMKAYLAAAFSIDKQTAELADPERATWIAADGDGTAIGYAMLRRGTRAPGVDATSPAEVQRIYVDGQWHGRRVGQALMDQCVEEARGWSCDVVWLGVFQENPRAIAFYGRSGFTIVGAQTFTVGRDVQQDFVMARTLS